MTTQYLIQFNNWIIVINIFITINILKAVNIYLIFYRLQKYFIIVKRIYNLFYLNFLYFLYNIKKSYLYTYINKKQDFIFKLQDRILTFSWVFSIVLKKYAFYHLNLGFVLYLINIYFNIYTITYIYTINFLICFILVLILIIKSCDQKNRFKNKIFKFMLYLLLWVNLAILLYVFIKMINHIFVFIVTKLWNLKNLIKNNLSNKNPNPDDPDFNIYSSDSKNKKKKNKYIQQRAQEMRDKLLFQQKSQDTMRQNINFNRNSLSTKRGINNIIYIEPRQNLDLETQLGRIKDELKAYNIQQKKFKLWSKGKGKDFTYPEEARELFKEYSRLLKDLRPSLKSMKKKVKKQLKK